MSGKILVIGEIKEDEVRNVSFESIAAAKMMSSDAEIVGLLLGETNLEEQSQEMIHYGADRVITVTHPHLKHYTSEGYGQAIMAVIDQESPAGIVMGHTATGKDITPKIASKLDAG